MRLALALMLLVPSVGFAQTEETVKAVERKLETLRYVAKCEAPDGGFYPTTPDPKGPKPQPSLRATSAAARAWKYLGGEAHGAKFPNKDKHAAFVLSCYDPKTGAFAEPGGKPDVAITSVGVMAAVELGIPKEKIAKSMEYLKATAKTFEEVRIGAAAVEAWGVKDCPFKLDDWFQIAKSDLPKPMPAVNDGGARVVGSVAAFVRRLDLQKDNDTPPDRVAAILNAGQLPDGGWNRQGEKASDVESTYRVMRALMLLKQKPKDVKKLREFIDAHRTADGGYAPKPGEKSSVGGVYYAAIISKWLDDMDAKK